MAIYALGWGLVAGSAALIGALIGWHVRPPPRLIALLLAFASGNLLSVAAFELFDEAFAHGGLVASAVGFLIGAALFAGGLAWFDRSGARHRKRSTEAIVAGRDVAGVVALATIVDGVPEALIIGINFYDGTGLGIATVIAVFLSNIPESLSSTARMRAVRRRPSYVAAVWIAVALVTGLAAFAGYTLLGDLPAEGKAVLQAMAGGAFLVYIADAVIPEAFAETRDLSGLAMAIGFLTGYSLSAVLG